MNIWIFCSLILSIVLPIFYTKSMLAGKAKPHRTTRLIVLLTATAGFLGVIHSPNLAGVIFAVILLIRSTYLFVMACIYGLGGTTRLDKYCLIIAIIALGLYFTTGNGLLAITFGILADSIGYLPTFVKTWHKPKSEDPAFFIIECFASLFALFAIWEIRPDILFPLYFLSSSVSLVILMYRKQILRRIKIWVQLEQMYRFSFIQAI